MDFSVVIPTYNRCQVLVRTLQALLAQKDDSCPSSYEIVVVDDGSTDETERQVRDLESAASGQIVYLHQPNRKQGAARNLGAGKAQGDFLVFLGDDTIPDPGFLSQHSAGRRKRGQWSRDSRLVVIGRTRWARHLATTRFTRYIGEQGWQFGFSLIADPENVPFNFFYTSNLSIGRRFFLDSGGFDEDFQEYGWEDIELSLRLCKNGMRLVYQPDAVAWHDHPTSLRSFVRRQRKVGFSAWKFYEKHPEMAGFLGALKARRYSLGQRLRMEVLTVLCALSETRTWPDFSRYYPDLMSYHYNLGVLQARRQRTGGKPF